jgi:hypothetical protein
MADTQVLGGLVAKRGELAGQVEQSRREVQRLAEELSHLDATIRLFDPDDDVGAVQSKGPRHRQQWFGSGECQRLVLEALRDAREPLSARAVMQLVAARKAVLEHPEVRAGVHKTVQAVRRCLAAKGAARVVALDGHTQVWTRGWAAQAASSSSGRAVLPCQ